MEQNIKETSNPKANGEILLKIGEVADFFITNLLPIISVPILEPLNIR